MADDVLLDAFVEIKPRMAADFDAELAKAKQKVEQMFAGLKPASGISVDGGQKAAREADRQARQQAIAEERSARQKAAAEERSARQQAAAEQRAIREQERQAKRQAAAEQQAIREQEREARQRASAEQRATREAEQQQQNEFNQRLQVSADLIQDLRQQATFAAQDLRSLGQADLANPFRVAQRELSNLSRELRRATTAEDLVPIEARLFGVNKQGEAGLARQIAEARQSIFRSGGPSDVRSGLAAQFEAASREIEDTKRQLDRVIDAASQLENKDIARDFRRFKIEIADIKTLIERAFGAADTTALDAQLQRIREIQGILRVETPDTFGRPGAAPIPTDPNSVIGRVASFEFIKTQAQDILRDLERQITQTYQERLPNLLALPGPDKAGFLADLNLYRRNVIELQELLRQFGLAKDAEEAKNLVDQIVTKLGAAGDLELIPTQLSPTAMADPSKTVLGQAEKVKQGFASLKDTGTASFNSLQNNMFQLGQAFEDAAIGYELNGITGAVRGASNNIAFLINSLSTTANFQKRVADLFPLIGAKASLLVPLIAGIGTALGIVVLPRLVEWLESLNDIEIGVEDVSRKFQQLEDDVKFDIDLGLESGRLSRDLSSAGSVEDVLKRLRSLTQETDDRIKSLGKSISETLGGQAGKITDIQLFTGPENAAKTFFEAFKKEASKVSAELLFNAPVGENAEQQAAIIEQIRIQSTIAAGPLKNLSDNFLSIRDYLSEIRAQSDSGLFNAQQIQNARKQIDSVIDQLSGQTDTSRSLLGQLDVSDPKKIENIVSNLNKLRGSIELYAKEAAKIEEVQQNQFQIALDAAVQKTQELADRQTLLRRQIEGTADAESEFLLDVIQVSSEYARLVDLSVQAARESGRSAEDIEKLRSALEESGRFDRQNQILENQKGIVEQIREKRQRIAELMGKEEESNRRSRQIDLERYAAGLQESVLSIENAATKDNTDALRELTDEIQTLEFRLLQRQGLMDIISAPGGAGPDASQFTVNRLLEAQPGQFLRLPAFESVMRQTVPAMGIGAAGVAFDAIRQAEQAVLLQQRQTELLQVISERLGIVAGEQRGTTQAVKQQDTKARAGQ